LIGVVRRFVILLALAGAWFAAPAAAAPIGSGTLTLSFDRLVADDAGVFSAAFKQEMQERLTRIEEQTGVSVVLVTAPGIQGADSGRLAEAIGEKLQGLGNIRKHWVIFLLAPADRVFSASLSVKDETAAEAIQNMENEKKLELGRRIARVFSDAVTPGLKASQWEAGMRAGVDAMERYLGNAEKSAPPVEAPAASGDVT